LAISIDLLEEYAATPQVCKLFYLLSYQSVSGLPSGQLPAATAALEMRGVKARERKVSAAAIPAALVPIITCHT
jgi:hypothetical protein